MKTGDIYIINGKQYEILNVYGLYANARIKNTRFERLTLIWYLLKGEKLNG